MSAAEDLQEAFYNFDQDRDGYLTLDELRYIVTSDGEKMPNDEVEEFIQEAGSFSQDGYFDYKAFSNMLLSEEE
jgi:Ca2+-binding EF-hand superfamily protein